MLAAVVGPVDGDGGPGVGDDERPRGHAEGPLTLAQLLGDVVDRSARKLLGLVSLATLNEQMYKLRLNSED